jgi:TrpR family trp operon transcriptional repressor
MSQRSAEEYNAIMSMDTQTVEQNIRELSEALGKTGDPKLLDAFLRCLLTPAEIKDIAARWALVKALDKKIPQREIARRLGVSLCKITRGSRELKKPGSAFRRILDMNIQTHSSKTQGLKQKP